MTFLGYKVYSAPMLKIYFPFVMSATLTFFLVSSFKTKLSNDPHDKWNNILTLVKRNNAEFALITEATEYMEKGPKAATPKHH